MSKLELSTADAMVLIDSRFIERPTGIQWYRITVHDVVSALKQAYPIDEILLDYSALSAEQIRLSVVYAQAHPLTQHQE